MALKWVSKRKKRKSVKEQPKDDKLIDSRTGKTPIPEKDVKKYRFYYECDTFVPYKEPIGFLSNFRKSKDIKFMERNRGKVVLIKMEMSNGQFREFLVLDDCGAFVYNQSRYVLDPTMKYFIIERNLWAYDFHEFISLPIKKQVVISYELESLLQPALDSSRKKPIKPHIDVNEIKTLIENSKVVDVETSINPLTLKRFTDSEVIKQVLQGAMLSRFFKIMFIMVIVVGVIVLLLLAVNLYSSGLIEKVAGYF